MVSTLGRAGRTTIGRWTTRVALALGMVLLLLAGALVFSPAAAFAATHLTLEDLHPWGAMSRGEVAQVLYNVVGFIQ